MQLLSPPAVACADTEATLADCLPGSVLPRGRTGYLALVDLQAKPLLMPDRPQLRPDYALLVAGAHPAAAVLVVKMTVHLDPPELIVHSLRQAQHLRHAAVDGIWEFIRAAGDRAPAEVGRKHARRIRTGVSDSATARQGRAKVPAGRCSGVPSPGLSCLRLPDPANTDCPGGAWRSSGQRPGRAWELAAAARQAASTKSSVHLPERKRGSA